MDYYEGSNRQNKLIRVWSTCRTCNQQKQRTSEIGKTTEFDKFFTNIGPELSRKIPTASRTFEGFLNKIDTTTPAD